MCLSVCLSVCCLSVCLSVYLSISLCLSGLCKSELELELVFCITPKLVKESRFDNAALHHVQGVPVSAYT